MKRLDLRALGIICTGIGWVGVSIAIITFSAVGFSDWLGYVIYASYHVCPIVGLVGILLIGLDNWKRR